MRDTRYHKRTKKGSDRRNNDRRVRGGWSADMEKSLRLYSRILFRHGVNQAVIDRVDSEVRERLFDGTQKKGRRKADTHKSVEFDVNRRKDFFGRAVLFKIEVLFPKTARDDEAITRERIEGELPRQVAAGLISAIRETIDTNLMRQYDSFFSGKANRYKRKRSGDVDIASFGNDGGVRAVSSNVMDKFDSILDSMGEEKGRVWLRYFIESSPRFGEMERKLSEEEYDAITESLTHPKAR